jgi:copper chaperone CopZ
MECPACAKVLDRRLERVQGVASAESDLLRGMTSVVFDQMRVDEDAIAAIIRGCGFEATIHQRS